MNRRIALLTFLAGLALGAVATLTSYRYFTGERARVASLPSPPHAPDARHSEPARPPRTGQVYIDPAMVQNLGVRTVAAQTRSITDSIRTTGYVDYDQERVVSVNARISGWIEKLHVAYVGQRVNKGQRLLEIYSPELVLTEEDYLRSRRLAAGGAAGQGAAQRDGRQLMEAAETKMRLLGVPASETNRLRETGKAAQTVPFNAPVSGVVTQSKAVEGAYIKAGDDLYTITDLSRVWVYADIYERELHKVRVGQMAEVTSDALAGNRFRGRVSYIYPNVGEQSRTVRVRLEFQNPKGLLKPGMYVKTTLIDDSPERHLAVPTEAVLDSGVRKIVIVDLGQGRFEPREVEVGNESGGYFPISKGLSQGERVVTSAQFLIDSESNLHEALEAMSLGREKNENAARKRPGKER